MVRKFMDRCINSEKKKIAFFFNSFARGGAERVVSRLFLPLGEFYDVFLILIDGSRIQYECPVKIIKMGGAERRNRFWYLIDQIKAKNKLESIVKEYKIECIISFLDVPNLINLLSKTECKKIVSVRCEELNRINDKIKGYMCKKAFHKADAVISVSNALQRSIVDQWYIRKDKVVTIENPYNIMEIRSQAERKMSAAEDDFYRGHRVIVALGRMEKQKGYTYLLDSFHHLLSLRKDAGLVIVGDGGERKKLEAKIRQMKMDKAVLLCGMKENPFPYIRNAQVFVLSSIAEGFPNALVEAMCLRVPVVACDCRTGPREILCRETDINMDKCAEEIEMADYGILVPDFTPRNHLNMSKKKILLANAINILLSNDELRKEYGNRASERAARYTFGRCIEKYKEVIG